MRSKSKSRLTTRYLATILFPLMLTACGGGSNSLTGISAQDASEPRVNDDMALHMPIRSGVSGGVVRPGSANTSTTTSTTSSHPTTSSTSTAPISSTSSSTSTTRNTTGSTTKPTTYKGVNLSGAEYNNSNPQARMGWDYIYPTTAEIDYYASKGFTTIRLPFAGARLQPVNNAALNTTELGYIQSIVNYCATKHINVILDPHDYGLKYDSTSGNMLAIGMPGGLPVANFANFWSLIAQAFKNQSNVIFGLMNEPNQQTPTQWATAANAAIAAIRATGATQLILIPGTDYTGAYDWVSSSNATAWSHVTDTANNFAFEVHQYLDSDSSGTHATCVAGKGSTALAAVTAWARGLGYHLFLGEVGWSQDPSCTAEGPAIMNYTSNNADVWIGWTYWAGGPWIPQSYIFMLDPASFTAPVDQPQMQTLIQNL